MAQRRSRRTAAAAAESRIARAVEDESEDSNGSNYGADNSVSFLCNFFICNILISRIFLQGSEHEIETVDTNWDVDNGEDNGEVTFR